MIEEDDDDYSWFYMIMLWESHRNCKLDQIVRQKLNMLHSKHVNWNWKELGDICYSTHLQDEPFTFDWWKELLDRHILQQWVTRQEGYSELDAEFPSSSDYLCP